VFKEVFDHPYAYSKIRCPNEPPNIELHRCYVVLLVLSFSLAGRWRLPSSDNCCADSIGQNQSGSAEYQSINEIIQPVGYAGTIGH